MWILATARSLAEVEVGLHLEPRAEGLFRSGSKRSDRYHGDAIASPIAVAGADDHAQRFGLPDRFHVDSLAELQEGRCGGVYLPAAQLRLERAPVSLPFLDDIVHFEVRVVAVVEYFGVAGATVDGEISVYHRLEQQAEGEYIACVRPGICNVIDQLT